CPCRPPNRTSYADSVRDTSSTPPVAEERPDSRTRTRSFSVASDRWTWTLTSSASGTQRRSASRICTRASSARAASLRWWRRSSRPAPNAVRQGSSPDVCAVAPWVSSVSSTLLRRMSGPEPEAKSRFLSRRNGMRTLVNSWDMARARSWHRHRGAGVLELLDDGVEGRDHVVEGAAGEVGEVGDLGQPQDAEEDVDEADELAEAGE